MNLFNCKQISKHNQFDENANKAKSHYHNYYELFYFIGDNMTYFIDNRPIKLVKHDIVLIPPNTYHRSTYSDDSNQERVVISFSEQLFNFVEDESLHQNMKLLFKRNFVHIVDADIKSRVYSTILNIGSAYQSNSNAGIIRAKLLLCELVLYITDIVEALPNENSRELLTAIEKNVYKVVNYINAQYMNKISLDNIAKRFFISKYYLCRVFKDIIGMSVNEFINAKRITEAATYLQNTDKSISHIATSVGLYSQAFFIKLFKKQYGVTPSEYRRRYR